jgi:mRNA interferase RelE/StbE
LRVSDAATAKKIRAAVNDLERDSAPSNSASLGGRFRRLHIGQWRILYELDDDTVRIWLLGRART